MARVSRLLMSAKQLNAPVAEPVDESDAQESSESPTVQKAEADAGTEKKKSKQPAKPSIAAMIKMAGIKRNRG